MQHGYINTILSFPQQTNKKPANKYKKFSEQCQEICFWCPRADKDRQKSFSFFMTKSGSFNDKVLFSTLSYDLAYF